MQDAVFEWDDEKAAANWRRHGVAFPQAVLAFRDPFALEWIDDREDTARSASTCWGNTRGCCFM